MRQLFLFLIPITIFIIASLSLFSPQMIEEPATKQLSEKHVGLAEKIITPMGSDDVYINAEAVVLLDGDTGNVLWQKNANEPLPPASMSKVMTMYLILEALENEEMDIEDDVDISEVAAGTGGASIYLREGSVLSVADLFQATAIASANDASVALAEYAAGSEEAFIDRMNEKARELGLSQDAHFINASGLPHETLNFESRMTALDTALLGYHLLHDYPDIIDLTKQPTLSLSYRNQILPNTNELLESKDVDANIDGADVDQRTSFPEVDGLKTGYTRGAGYSFIGTSEQHGKRLIAVVMRTDSSEARFEETQKILKAGFEHVHEDLRVERE
ncbi:D-alanyl-D-alanine carboxypeptidase family protein [Salicibibacter kimchii]|uniref:D-alanyl-D-alanine carboxypeptidase n=1 Tax=Salicibibacter kimchii TaxID=2099786 RepID=A0A345BVJ4_9BACI|nr:D-alanyl-D-alanine carboxypeptidase family protein [Salicibibacter kimchii]AXF54975.1 D-alanyl-D-alanine carboxypeptidase [Salicibibacter kimchii]